MNAIIGDNGIITNAMRAKEMSNFSSAIEELEIMMAEFNMGEQTGSSSLKEFMNKKIEAGKITSYRTKRNAETNTIQCIIEKDGYLFYAIPTGDYWKIVTQEEYAKSGENKGVDVQVFTKDNVSENKSFVLGNAAKETEVVFYDEVDGELNFEIKEGVVNIYLYNDMKLTNSGMERSAIDIYPGATLNLYLEEGAKMIVDSGEGKEGTTASGLGALGGPRRLRRNTCTMDR